MWKINKDLPFYSKISLGIFFTAACLAVIKGYKVSYTIFKTEAALFIEKGIVLSLLYTTTFVWKPVKKCSLMFALRCILVTMEGCPPSLPLPTPPKSREMAAIWTSGYLLILLFPSFLAVTFLILL